MGILLMVSAGKLELGNRLKTYLDEYSKILIVKVDNVGSHQFAQIRYNLRGKAHLLKIKNTLLRTVMRKYIAETGKTDLNKLLDVVADNIALVFCISSDANAVGEVRDIILENRVPAPAKEGVIAPLDYFIKAGPTTMEPTMTSFFQALNIATKIVKSKIEIIGDVQVTFKGEKVGASEAVLLHKMKVMPFSYGFESTFVYDNGECYSASVLDITDEMLQAGISEANRNVAALSRAVGLPSTSSVPHAIVETFKNCAALALAG